MARTGKGLSQGVLKVGSLTIDSRIKVGACLWLADKYDKDFGEVMGIFEAGKFNDVMNLVVALAIQHDPDKTEPEVRKAIAQLEIEELTELAASLTSAFETDVKNSTRPVKGNLQE